MDKQIRFSRSYNISADGMLFRLEFIQGNDWKLIVTEKRNVENVKEEALKLVSEKTWVAFLEFVNNR